MKAINFTIDGHLPSRANLRQHWRARAKMAKEQREKAHGWALAALMQTAPIDLPVRVTLARVSPRLLDDDNLQTAFKSYRDGIADALGMDDRDPRIDWRYDQRKGKPPRAEIQIQEARNDA